MKDNKKKFNIKPKVTLKKIIVKQNNKTKEESKQ